MTLSEYDEWVIAELETQFSTDDPGLRLSLSRLAVPAIVLLGGVALLIAAHQTRLVILISDFCGFTTSSIASSLGLAGHALLLGGAVLLGWVGHGIRRRAAEPVGAAGSMFPPVSREGRSERPASL